jgi:hypothetical protein
MQDSTTLAELDDLNPFDRLEALLAAQSAEVQVATRQVLVGLYIVDAALEMELAVRSSYILDDGTLFSWLSAASEEQFDQTSYTLSLILLDEADLIFRFTCAKKFAVDSDRLKQERINSWGKAYVVEKGLLATYANATAALQEVCETELTAHRNAYLELVALLHRPIDAAAAKAITGLNQGLKLQLLS